MLVINSILEISSSICRRIWQGNQWRYKENQRKVMGLGHSTLVAKKVTIEMIKVQLIAVLLVY